MKPQKTSSQRVEKQPHVSAATQRATAPSLVKLRVNCDLQTRICMSGLPYGLMSCMPNGVGVKTMRWTIG